MRGSKMQVTIASSIVPLSLCLCLDIFCELSAVLVKLSLALFLFCFVCLFVCLFLKKIFIYVYL